MRYGEPDIRRRTDRRWDGLDFRHGRRGLRLDRDIERKLDHHHVGRERLQQRNGSVLRRIESRRDCTIGDAHGRGTNRDDHAGGRAVHLLDRFDVAEFRKERRERHGRSHSADRLYLDGRFKRQLDTITPRQAVQAAAR